MPDLVEKVNFIRHDQIHPLLQSLKAHQEIAHNSNLHISPSVLKDIAKRVQIIETNLLTLIE